MHAGPTRRPRFVGLSCLKQILLEQVWIHFALCSALLAGISVHSNSTPGRLVPKKAWNPSERKGIWKSSLAHKPIASGSFRKQTGLQSALMHQCGQCVESPFVYFKAKLQCCDGWRRWMWTNKGERATKPKNKKLKKKQPAINIINLSESQAPNSSEFAASLKHLS